MKHTKLEKFQRDLARRITNRIFTDRGVTRLTLEEESRRDRPSKQNAGWCRDALADQILEELKA